MMAMQPDTAMDEDLWIVHRDTLRKLYIVENKTLKEVKSTMESLNGFPKVPWALIFQDLFLRWCEISSESTYESKLRDHLGLRKNLKCSDWQAIGHHLEKRRREGKEDSEVVYNGVPMPRKKVRKEVSRNQKQNLWRSPIPHSKQHSRPISGWTLFYLTFSWAWNALTIYQHEVQAFQTVLPLKRLL